MNGKYGVFVAIILTGCSSQEIAPKVALPEVPKLTSAPHPTAYGSGALEALFLNSAAPLLSELENCRRDFETLEQRTLSREELQRGVIELIEQDPTHYHWCFYSELRKAQKAVESGTEFLEDLQTNTLKAFSYLTYVAQAFRLRFSDTRYLRHAVVAYTAMSPRVFYKTVKLTDKTVETLLSNYNPEPYGVYDSGGGAETPVLEKYGIGRSIAEEKDTLPEVAP